MLKVTLLILVLNILSLNATVIRNISTNNATVKSTDENVQHRNLFGGAFVTPVERAAMKFVAYVFQKPSFLGLTMGVVVTRNWVITPSDPVDGKDPSELGVTVCGGVALTDPGGITSEVKENVKNPDCASNPLIDCVSLLRICPAITPDHAAVLVPSLSPYRATSVTVNVVMYQVDYSDSANPTKLYKITKNIGDVSVCNSIANFVLNNHVCLANDNNVYAYIFDNTDIPGYIVMDSSTNDVIGFLVEIQSGSDGEVVLHLESVRTFIDNTV